MVQRVQELVVQASNGSESASDLQSTQDEVNQLKDAIKQEANTQYNGQYVFSGTATGTEPYSSSTGDVFQGKHQQRDPGGRPQLLGAGQRGHLVVAGQRLERR